MLRVGCRYERGYMYDDVCYIREGVCMKKGI